MRKIKVLILVVVFLLSLMLFVSGVLFMIPKQSLATELDIETQTEMVVVETMQTTDTPTATSTELPTDVPTNTPTPTNTPFYDAVYPLNIEGENGAKVNFSQISEVVTKFDGKETTAGVVIHNEDEDDFEQQLGGCSGANLVISNARSGEEYVTYKTLIFAHSGTCKNGRIMPFESIRAYLEGPFYNPNIEKRTEMLKQIISQKICFDEACFTVVDAVYVTREQVEQMGYVDGMVDWYFESGEIPNTQEIFLGFCGSEGGIPTQWFSAKYYIRLQREN